MHSLRFKCFGMALCVLICVSNTPVAAQNVSNNQSGMPQFLTTAYGNEFGWRQGSFDSSEGQASSIIPDAGHENLVNTNASDTLAANAQKFKNKPASEDEIIDKILKKIPYHRQLRATWNLVDGETDLYVDGLRFDRRNKGVTYTTDTLPIMGQIDGLKIKASAGKDQEISVRYKVSLDKLGL